MEIIANVFKNQKNIIFYDGPETSVENNDSAQIIMLQKSSGSFHGASDQKNGTFLKSKLFKTNKVLHNDFSRCIFLFPNICWPTNNFLFFDLIKIIKKEHISFYYEGIGSYLSHKQSFKFEVRNRLKSIVSVFTQRNTFNAYSGNFMYGKFHYTASFYGPKIGNKKANFKEYNCIELPENLFRQESEYVTNSSTEKQCLILGWPAKSHDEQLIFIKKAKVTLTQEGLENLVYKPHPLQRQDKELLLKITNLGLTITSFSDAVERLYDPKIHAAIVSPFSSSLLHIKSKYPESRCIAIVDSDVLKRGVKFGVLKEDEIRALFTSMEIEIYS